MSRARPVPDHDRRPGLWRPGVARLALCGAFVALASGAFADLKVGHDVLTVKEWETRVGGPTLITLQGKACTLRDVRAALAAQTDREDLFVGRNGFGYEPLAFVDFNISKAPFWEALGTVVRETPNALPYMDGLTDFTALAAKATSMPKDAMWVVPVGVSRFASRNIAYTSGGTKPQPADARLQLRLLMGLDPKADAITGGITVQLDTATDDAGRSLITKQDSNTPYDMSRSLFRSVTVSLAYAPPSRKLSRLAGKVRVPVFTRSFAWKETLSPNEPTEKTITLDEGAFQLSAKPAAARDAGQTSAIDIHYVSTAKTPYVRQMESAIFSRIRITDKDGNPLSVTGVEYANGSGRNAPDTVEYARRIVYVAPQDRTAPISITWQVPQDWDFVELPFDLKDIPLPSFDIAFPDMPGGATAPAVAPTAPVRRVPAAKGTSKPHIKQKERRR